MKWLSRRRSPIVLMLIAPANLHGVNRLYGLAAGDDLIDRLQDRVESLADEYSVVSRLSGGKFAIGVRCEDSAAAAALARNLRERCAEDGRNDGPIAVRIGAAWIAQDENSAFSTDAIVEASLTAYDDTTEGGVSLIELDREGARDGLAMARRALAAIKAGDCRIALQPVVSSDGSGRVIFREALMRVVERDGEDVAAGRFMPALDRLGMTEEVDIAALRLTFAELERDRALRVSVNLSGASIRRCGWPAVFAELATRSPDCAERLIIEVTEEAALANANETAGLFAMIRAHGAALAIDDFGAGRTSFSHLRDFRFDMVKIDGGFIRGIDHKPDNKMLVSALVAIARQFDMTVIAEHVENASEARALRALEVDGFQGYLFGRPALVWCDGEGVPQVAG